MDTRHLTTLFIWEGVSMYIDAESVDATLAVVAQNSGEGSGIIFDYTYQEVVSGESDRKEAIEWLKIAKKSTEPLLFGIGKSGLEQFLSERKFCNIKNITNNYFADNYFVGPNKGRASTPILAIAHAQIKTL